jgi:AmmeMemoRadiSam system protein A
MTAPQQHPLVRLARAAVEAYVCEQRVLQPEEWPETVDCPPAGVFVTLHRTSTGHLRGCIGTIEPCEETIVAETIRNAISAATRDPRFDPVLPGEVADLTVDVSVLHPPERVAGLEQLDPHRYGVIVQRGTRRGLLLPDIPGIEDAETQVDIACQKAWIARNEPVTLYRFQVDKYV